MSSLAAKEVLVDRKAPLHLYAQLQHGLRNLIQTSFEDGERFYNEVFLSERLGVSVYTVRRAMAHLVTEGLVERRVAKGTFVRKRRRGRQGTLALGVFLAVLDSSFDGTVLHHISALCGERGHRMHVYYIHKGVKTCSTR